MYVMIIVQPNCKSAVLDSLARAKLRTEQAFEAPPEERLRRLGKSNNAHRIVESEDEMLRLLDEGRELVRELNVDRFL